MRLLSDENFNNDILRGLMRIDPTLDIVRVQDTPVYQAPDPVILDWAAKENRIVLTHDVQTITKYAYDRVRVGVFMPGVIEVMEQLDVGRAIDELSIVIGASDPGEFENRIIFVPLN